MTIPGLIHLFNSIKDPDKEKRELAQKLILDDPERFQRLVDSQLSDNPKALSELFGRDARWGGNRNASSNLVNAVQNAPLSDLAQARANEQLQKTDVNSSQYQQVAKRANKGKTPEQLFEEAKAAYKGLREGTSSTPQYVTSQQSDILAKSRGLPTAAEKEISDAGLAGVKANITNTQANTARTNQAVKEGEVNFAADSVIDNYYNLNPARRGRDLLEMYNDKSTPQEVRDALPISNKYAKTFGVAFDKFYKDKDLQYQRDRLDIEKKRLAFDRVSQQDMLQRYAFNQAADSWQAMDHAGGQQGFKGLVDIYSGNSQSPEAAAISKQFGQKQKNKLVEQYNTQLKNLIANQKDLLKGGQTEPAVMIAIDEINSLASALRTVGINKEDITIGEETSDEIPGVRGTVASMPFIGGLATKRTIKTVKGGMPSPAIDQEAQKEELKAKGALYEQLKAANPNLPESALRARVEAEYLKRNKSK